MTTAFQLASDYVDDVCALTPVLSTQLGVPGSDHEWGESFGVGENFDLKTFHSTVLDGGTMRLDLLREVMTEPLAS